MLPYQLPPELNPNAKVEARAWASFPAVIPAYTSKRNSAFRRRVVAYGDGYEQCYADGLHPNPRIFAVVFDPCPNPNAQTVINFLEATNGITPFTWVPPAPYNQTVGTFRCDDLSYEWQSWSSAAINATFREIADY
jgi:phage-related protein